MRTKQNMVIEQTYEYAKKNMRKEDPQSQKVLGQLQEGKEHDDQEPKYQYLQENYLCHPRNDQCEQVQIQIHCETQQEQKRKYMLKKVIMMRNI